MDRFTFFLPYRQPKGILNIDAGVYLVSYSLTDQGQTHSVVELRFRQTPCYGFTFLTLVRSAFCDTEYTARGNLNGYGKTGRYG